MGICCVARETQTGALYQPRGVEGEGDSKGRGYMYTNGWFMWRFDRKQRNSVKQLSFDNKKKKEIHEGKGVVWRWEKRRVEIAKK